MYSSLISFIIHPLALVGLAPLTLFLSSLNPLINIDILGAKLKHPPD
ncbi:hypothetical protein K9U65_14515 [Providencia stuartii]